MTRRLTDQDGYQDESNQDERHQRTLDDFGSSSAPAVEAILYEVAPDIITVEDIADALGVTKSDARLRLNDAIDYGAPRLEIKPVGDDVYLVQQS